LLKQTDYRVESICADGAYDAQGVYEAAQMKGHGQVVRVLISPGTRRTAASSNRRGL